MHGWKGTAKHRSMGRGSRSGWRVSVFGEEREEVPKVGFDTGLSGIALISCHRTDRRGLCSQAT